MRRTSDTTDIILSTNSSAAASEFRRQNGHLHDAVCRGRHAGVHWVKRRSTRGRASGGLRASVRRTAPRAPVVHELKVDRLRVVHFNQESDTPAFRLWHKGAAARVRRVRKTLVTWHSGAKGVHPNHSEPSDLDGAAGAATGGLLVLVPRDARILRGAREPPRGTATQHAEVLAHLVRVRVRVGVQGLGQTACRGFSRTSAANSSASTERPQAVPSMMRPAIQEIRRDD